MAGWVFARARVLCRDDPWRWSDLGRPTARLVGRDVEVARLEHALEALRAGHPGVVLVEGEAGIGKTCLAIALRHLAEQRGCLTLQGACFESERTVPYAPLIDLLQSMLADVSRGPD